MPQEWQSLSVRFAGLQEEDVRVFYKIQADRGL